MDSSNLTTADKIRLLKEHGWIEHWSPDSWICGDPLSDFGGIPMEDAWALVEAKIRQEEFDAKYVNPFL